MVKLLNIICLDIYYIFSLTVCFHTSLKVSILNGIVMGGGAGASIHGRFRVATENSVYVSPTVDSECASLGIQR